MPYVDGQTISPDEAIAKGLCPETGIDLRTVDRQAHVDRLWPRLDPRNGDHTEAIRRRNMILDFKG